MLAHVVLVVIGAAAPAAVRVPVDSERSTLDVTLCVLGVCDSDMSPIVGYLDVGLAPMADPATASLRDFDVQTARALHLYLSYGLLGKLDVLGTDLGMRHAQPGPDQPFVPIADGNFAFPNVPYLKRGTIQYQATGVVCSLLQGQGLPCSDTIDLAADPPAVMATVTGTIEIADGVVTLAGTMTFTQPLDPDNPSVGTITGTATLQGRAPLPRPGDFDGDADVDLSDFLVFQACFNGPNRPPAAAGCLEADLDAEGDVDLNDFLTFQACFNGPNRPPACR